MSDFIPVAAESCDAITEVVNHIAESLELTDRIHAALEDHMGWSPDDVS